jgi:hypothetical protein
VSNGTALRTIDEISAAPNNDDTHDHRPADSTADLPRDPAISAGKQKSHEPSRSVSSNTGGASAVIYRPEPVIAPRGIQPHRQGTAYELSAPDFGTFDLEPNFSLEAELPFTNGAGTNGGSSNA